MEKKRIEDQMRILMRMINVSIEMICQHKYGQILHTMSNDLSHSKSRMDALSKTVVLYLRSAYPRREGETNSR
jgi:hypothetical protein